MSDDDVTFAEMDYADWLRQLDRIENGELADEFRAIVNEMRADLPSDTAESATEGQAYDG